MFKATDAAKSHESVTNSLYLVFEIYIQYIVNPILFHSTASGGKLNQSNLFYFVFFFTVYLVLFFYFIDTLSPSVSPKTFCYNLFHQWWTDSLQWTITETSAVFFFNEL